jgi:hypothetical protein
VVTVSSSPPTIGYFFTFFAHISLFIHSPHWEFSFDSHSFFSQSLTKNMAHTGQTLQPSTPPNSISRHFTIFLHLPNIKWLHLPSYLLAHFSLLPQTAPKTFRRRLNPIPFSFSIIVNSFVLLSLLLTE